VKPAPLADAHEEREFGGKAASLARSLRAGLPVPPGFALATLHVEAVARAEADAMVHVVAEFVALGGPCAVRSSAVGEDSESASFAGQHLTVLNVCSPDEVAPAVARVWASGRTEAALAYRRRLGLDEEPRVAVVVQRMVEPDCAGVLFTRNPLDGTDVRVIEGTWGLGEAVVAGLVVPDHWEIDRGGRILRCLTGEKDIALRSAEDGGTVEVPLPDDLAYAPCLDEAQLALLNDLAARCEAHFGPGLDLEWAFAGGELFLLQCRPMTSGR
jgi:pyruvate, water dikinase